MFKCFWYKGYPASRMFRVYVRSENGTGKKYLLQFVLSRIAAYIIILECLKNVKIIVDCSHQTRKPFDNCLSMITM